MITFKSISQRMGVTLLAIVGMAAMTAHAQSALYVSTEGNDANAGTLEAPFLTIHHAVEVCQPGDTIWVRGGHYLISERIKIPQKATSAQRRCYLWAMPGTGEVVIDGSAMHHTNQSDFKMGRCIYVNHLANYWHFKGLTLCHAEDNGMKLEGSYNIVEQCVFRDNNDTGLQIGMYKDFAIEETKELPKGEPQFNPGYQFCRGNVVINCDAYNNADLRTYNGTDDGGDADGFACKLFPGPGTEFHGCRAWTNSDDNWDLYMVYHPVVIDSCWAYHAGYTPDGTPIGNGNGFKLGGGGSSGGAAFSQSVGAHVVTNCVSFDNLHKGYDQNNAYEGMYLFNCTGWGNEYNYRFPTLFQYGGMVIRNCIGFKATRLNHEFLSADKEGSVVPDTDYNSWTTLDKCSPYKEGQKNDAGDKPMTKDYSDQFISLAASDFMAPRQADGSLPDNGFARLREGSVFKDQGTPIVQYQPRRFMTEAEAKGLELVEADYVTIHYNDAAPDFGAFELPGVPADIDDTQVEKATLDCTTGNATQTVMMGEAIADIVIAYSHATQCLVEGIAASNGMSYTIGDGQITISGTPQRSFRFQVTATGQRNTAHLGGSITVQDPNLRTWHFESVPSADAALIATDSQWKTDSKSRYCYMPAMDNAAVTASGQELDIARQLRFTVAANSDGNLRLGGTTTSMWLGNGAVMTIPDCRADDYVKVEYMTSSSTATRHLTATNLADELPTTTGKTHKTGLSKILSAGQVTLTVEGGMYFYSLAVGPLSALMDSTGSQALEAVTDDKAADHDAVCYDLFGHRLGSHGAATVLPHSGLYIIKGRKVMMR